MNTVSAIKIARLMILIAVIFSANLANPRVTEAQSVDIGWPFPCGETWYVLQGYYSNGKSHANAPSLDLLKNYPYSDADSGLATVVAPMSGTIGRIYTWYIDGYTNWAVEIVNGRYKFQLNHLEKPTTISVGQSVSKGDFIGKVFNQRLGGYRHLDIALLIDGIAVPFDVAGTVWQFPKNGPRPSDWGTWAETKLESSCGAASGNFSLLSLQPDHLEIFRRDPGGDARHRWWDGGASWHDSWENLGIRIRGAPVAVSWEPDRQDVFVRGEDNAIYHQTWTRSGNRGNWKSLGGMTYDDIAVLSLHADHLEVFHRGTDGNLYHKWSDNAGETWSDWENLHFKLRGKPAVVSWGPDRQDVFVRGEDDVMYHQTWTRSNGRTGWASLGGQTKFAPQALSWSEGRLDVFHLGLDGNFYHMWWEGTHQSAWQRVGEDQYVDTGFKLPYPGGAGYQCTQGNNSAFSHSGQYAYAFDFGMPRGREVVAARNGRVVAVKGDSRLGGCSSWYMPYANYIRIRHIDGSDTLYVHLDSVAVRNGDYVQRGQVIGRSGQTGYSCGAHLHFDRRSAGGSQTLATSFLDVAGGVPRTGGWYTSGNYVGRAAALLQGVAQPPAPASDAAAPVGEARFHLTGATPYTLWLAAEDDTTPLTALQMRLADSEAGLASAAWQPFAGEVSWEQPAVWVQYRDEAGNISASYADTLDPAATSPATAAFSAEPSVCASVELPIVNQTTPFCAQCQWEWDLGNGTTSIAPEPASAIYSAGTYTISLKVTGASSASTATRQVTALPAPDAAFDLTRAGDTVTVTAGSAAAAAWEWDFGDGSSATGQTATHTYAPGRLDADLPIVRLTVRGANGCSGQATAQVTPDERIYLPMIIR